MQPQKQKFALDKREVYHYQNNIDLSHICADINYFLVIPFAAQQADNPSKHQTVPYILTYLSGQIKVYELMKEYQRVFPESKDKYLYFTFRNSHKLNEGMTVQGLKKQLARQSLNGLVLFIKQDQDLQGTHYEDYLDSDFNQFQIYQKCGIQYLSNLQQFGNQKQMAIFVQIPQKQRKIPEVLTIRISGSSTLDDLKTAIINQMKKQFASINLKSQDIVELTNKNLQIPLNEYGTLIYQKIKIKNSTIIAKLANPNIQLRRLKDKNYNSYLAICNQEGIQSAKFRYNQVAQLTFAQLFNVCLPFAKSEREDLCYALRVMSLVIRPHDKINIAENYFKNQSRQERKVVGEIVHQQGVFYQLIPNLLPQDKDFKIEEYVDFPLDQIQKKRILKQLLQQIPTNTHFSKLIKTDKPLNKFLRETSLLTLPATQLEKQWHYLCCSALLANLNKLKKYRIKVYKSVNYDLLAKKGQIVTFKQFLIASLDREAAISSASQSMNPVKIMLELDLIQGYSIQQLSQLSGQKDILIEPFSSFQVVQIKNCTVNIVDEANKKYKQNNNLKVYVMNQKLTKKYFQKKTNFVIWIDLNFQEGTKIINSTKQISQSYSLIQLLSTEELTYWLVNNKDLFKQPNANLIFVTNMTRQEGNKWNQIAGIEALNIIRTYTKNQPVVFYIGDKHKAQKKLRENRVNTYNVYLTSLAIDVVKFLLAFVQAKY